MTFDDLMAVSQDYILEDDNGIWISNLDFCKDFHQLMQIKNNLLANISHFDSVCYTIAVSQLIANFFLKCYLHQINYKNKARL